MRVREPGEAGHALVETFLLGLLFLVPLIWTLGVLAEIHRAALATTAAAREAGADAARSVDLASAGRAVDLAVRLALADHGLSPNAAEVRWRVDPEMPRGAAVEVTVGVPVTVLQFPFLGRVAGPSVEVTARHAARIDPYRSR
ncbi:MAG: hypothetical protein M3345_05920 [Actinomycetota bacterium]|nr:hypothetical protein [Actinomycetota bacterium]